jgi:hypothetical protein
MHRNRASATPASYPAGHFCAPVRAWLGAFGPLWEPRIGAIEARNANGETAREVATRTREQGLAEGRAFAIGTIPMGGAPKISRPAGWI